MSEEEARSVILINAVKKRTQVKLFHPLKKSSGPFVKRKVQENFAGRVETHGEREEEVSTPSNAKRRGGNGDHYLKLSSGS